MLERMAKVRAAIAALRSIANACPFFPSLSHGEGQLAALLGQVQHGLEAPGRPFRILLTGGTGVGKSTLLNAFAGATIATTGARRPTTTGFSIYLHHSDVDPWLEALDQGEIIRHSRPELLGKVLLDSPDVDSAITEHRAVLERALALADLALVVVTGEKYVSESLFSLLREYHEGRAFAFVFNKTDLSPESSLIQDFRDQLDTAGYHGSPVFALSARNALTKHSEEGVRLDDDFGELVSYIGEELHASRIREIEQSNVRERAGIVTSFVRSLLPGAWEQAAQEWKDGCGMLFSEFLQEVTVSLQRLVLREDELAVAIASARGSSFEGPFGFVAELVYVMRRLRGNSPRFTTPGEVGEWLRARLNYGFWARLERREKLLLEACAQLGPANGLASDALREELEELEPESDGIVSWFRDHLAGSLASGWRQHVDAPGHLLNWLVNLPAWAWGLYWMYRLIQPVLKGQSPPWEAIPGAAVVLVVFLLIEWSLVHRLLRRDGAGRANRMVLSVLSDLDAEFYGSRGRSVATVAARIAQCTEQLSTALAALDAVADSSWTPHGERNSRDP